MVCPKCGSMNCNVQVVNEIKEKRKRGLLYWICCIWIIDLFMWIIFGFWKLIYEIFRKKTKIKSKTVSYAVCQDCGHKWKV